MIWGRDLLSRGIRWKVGDGKNIRVFSDPWLPRPSTFRTITPKEPHLSNLAVESLITPSRDWDIAQLNQYLWPVDVNTILSIPLSLRNISDHWVWHYDSKGVLSVRSAYRLEVEDKFNESSSSNGGNRGLWNKMWNANMPSKTRTFVWRCMVNCIPSFCNLSRRSFLVSQRSGSLEKHNFLGSISESGRYGTRDCHDPNMGDSHNRFSNSL